MEFQNHYSAPEAENLVLKATEGEQKLTFLWQSDRLNPEMRRALFQGRDDIFDVLLLRLQISVKTNIEGRSSTRLISRSLEIVSGVANDKHKCVRIILNQNPVHNRNALDPYWPERIVPASASRAEREQIEENTRREELEKRALLETIDQVSQALVLEVQRLAGAQGPAAVPLVFLREWSSREITGDLWCVGGESAFSCFDVDGEAQTVRLLWDLADCGDQNDLNKWTLAWKSSLEQPQIRRLVFRDVWRDSDPEVENRVDFLPDDNADEEMLQQVPALVASIATWLIEGSAQHGGFVADAGISDLIQQLSLLVVPTRADVNRSIYTEDIQVYFKALDVHTQTIRAGKRLREEAGNT